MPAAPLNPMPRPASILAALTDDELGDFLPGPLLERAQSLPDRFTRWNTAGRSDGEFVAALATTDPEILIACWSTPALPDPLPPRLRYVCYLCGSVRELVKRAHLERGLLVTNWGGSIARIVAEGALMHILACLRRNTRWTLAMHTEGAWKQNGTDAASLFGRRVGLHGFGQIARELVKLLRPFDVVISSFAPDIGSEVEAAHGIRRAASLESLFADNDIIVELAPLNPATVGIVQEKHLRLIRPGGVFVNVGRAAVVDEAALLRVAMEGKIMIGLDVFATEPLPADSPFRGLRNVSLTPHIAGPTVERRCDAGAFAIENLEASAAGQPLRAVITPEIYDIST